MLSMTTSTLQKKRPRPCNTLSRMASAILKHQRDEEECHEDVSLWGAPSECHEAVSRCAAADWEKLEEEVTNIFGSWDAFEQEVVDRTSAKFWHKLMNY